MRFSWLLWREGGGRRWAAALERFAGYTLGFLALGGAVALASLAQAWTLPWLAALASWLHGSR
jgi:hypothetical protein